jgi:hypothetical protein
MSWKGRRLAPLLLVLLVLTSCARVANYAALEPPARYNHPYDGPVVERVLPVNEVREICSDPSSPGLACSWVKDGTCYQILPSDGQAPLAVYRRHETAHCNGWPANHPQG